VAFQAGVRGMGKRVQWWRRVAWSLVVLALGLALSACGLEGLKNPSAAPAATNTSAPASVLALLAGGAAGAGSSDGNSVQSRFNDPQGAVSDGQGHVYVADTGNNTIRLLTSTNGAWSTVTIAGVAGTSGSTDTTVDSSGKPVSGSAPALFYNPIGLAVDTSGVTTAGGVAGTVLYVADFGNSTIRRVQLLAPTSGSTPVAVVSTIGGTAQTPGSVSGACDTAEFNGPIALALSSSRQELYVSDWGNNEIRRINLAGTAGLTSCAAAVAASQPASTATSGSTTPASTAELPYNVTLLAGHRGSTSSSGSTTDASVDGSATAAGFNGPQGLAQVYDASTHTTHIYVADSNSNIIRDLVVVGTGASSYGTVTTLSGVNGVSGAVDSSVTDTTTTSVTTASTITITSVTEVTLGATGIYPAAETSCSAAPANTTCTQTVSNNTGSFTPGSVTSYVQPQYSTPLYNFPTALTVDGSGNLIIADTGNDVVRKYNFSNKVVSTVVGELPTTTGAGTSGVTTYYPGDTDSSTRTHATALVDHPKGISYDASLGVLVLADDGNDRIRSIVDNTWVTTTIGGASSGFTDGAVGAAGFSNPQGVGFDSAGNAYVADSGNNSIRKVDSSGNVTTLAGQSGNTGGFADGSGTAALFNNPSGLVVDAGTGYVYVADTGNNSIRRIDASGNVTTIAGSTTAGAADGSGSGASFNAPTALALDGQGHLYVADTGNNTVRQLTLAGDAVVTVAGLAGVAGSRDTTTGFAGLFRAPRGIAVSGSVVYVADTGNNTLRQVKLASAGGLGTVTTVAGTVGIAGNADGSTGTSFNQPVGLALDGSGNIFVADQNNQTIREVTPAGVVSTVAGITGAAGFIAGDTPGLLAYPAGLASYQGSLYITMSDAVVSMSNLP